GLLMLRVEGRLMFANADHVAEKMRALVARAQPRVIVLECSAIPDVEYTALVMLNEAEKNLRDRDVALWLAAVNPGVMESIQRSPLGEALGPERIFADAWAVLEAWPQEPRPASDQSPITANGARS